jgi:hypothetical protein
MANVDAPFGFRPVGELGSNIQNGGTTRYRIADNQANAIYKGDVVFIGDGTVADQVGTAVTKGYIGASAAANVASIGVFNGCFITKHPTTGKPFWSNYYPGSINVASGEKIYAFVYDDPNKLYEVQANGTLADPTSVGSNADMAYTAGSTVNGQSKEELGTLIASGAVGQFVIVGISTDPANSDASNDNANWIVRLNEGRYLKTTLTTSFP